MGTARLPNVHASVSPPDVSTGLGPQINKIEQVFSDGHQMSLAGGRAREVPYLMSMEGLAPPWTDWLIDGRTRIKTLPSRNSIGTR